MPDRRTMWKSIGALIVGLGLLCPAYGADADKIKVGLMFGLTGPGSPIGPLQLDGAKLAIKEVNAAGGVKLGNRKLPVVFVVRDDENKPDVAIRRYREFLEEEKVNVIIGQTFAPLSGALNREVKKSPVLYFPVNVVALRMFDKSEIASTTFAVHGSAYACGYASASYIINNLKLKKIVFFGPAYAFGQDQWAGAKDALAKHGMKAEYLESPVGTSDFTPYLNKIAEMKPEIVMLAHWGVDAIGVLKQANEVGLKKNSKIWFDWMTNAFGSGVPPEALAGVYSLMSWYYDLKGFRDASVVKAADEFAQKYRKEYGYPPDPYSAMAYIGTRQALRAIELAQSTDSAAASAALMKSPKFDSMKGPGEWRQDHQPLFKYGAFVVQGKGPAERKDPKWDLVKVIGVYTGEDYLPPLSALGY